MTALTILLLTFALPIGLTAYALFQCHRHHQELDQAENDMDAGNP